VLVPLNHLAVVEVIKREAKSLSPEWLVVRMSSMPTLSQFDFTAHAYPFRQTLMNCAAVSEQWWYIFISAPWESSAENTVKINVNFRFAPACLGSALSSMATEGSSVHPTMSRPLAVFGVARPWTIIVVIFGAVVPELAVNELMELALATVADESTNIVVLLDRGSQRDGASFQSMSAISPGEGRVLELLLSQGAVRPLAKPADYPLSDPTVVAEFIARSVRRFPAERYAFLMWMRGGVLPCTLQVTADDEVEWNLSPRDLAKSLLLGLSLAGLPCFDLLFLDVPSTGCVEVVMTLGSAATFIVVTQHLIGWAGWNQTAMVRLAMLNELTVPRLVADALAPFDGSTPQSLTLICTAAYVFGPATSDRFSRVCCRNGLVRLERSCAV
jgi:hypothetical protein